MMTTNFAVYVFVRSSERDVVLIDCVSDWKSELASINSKLKTSKYYCQCVYYVESLAEGKRVLELINLINPSLKMQINGNLYCLSPYDAHKILKDIAILSGREEYLLGSKDAFRESSQVEKITEHKSEAPNIKEKETNPLSLAAKNGMSRNLARDIFLSMDKNSLDKDNFNFASKNKEGEFYRVTFKKLAWRKTWWYLILNDNINQILYLFKVPTKAINENQFMIYDEEPDKYCLEIDYNDTVNFKNYFVKYGEMTFGRFKTMEFSYKQKEAIEEYGSYPLRQEKYNSPIPPVEPKKEEVYYQMTFNEYIDTKRYIPATETFDGMTFQIDDYLELADNTIDVLYSEYKDDLFSLVDDKKIPHLSLDSKKFRKSQRAGDTPIYIDKSLNDEELLSLTKSLFEKLNVDSSLFIISIKRR